MEPVDLTLEISGKLPSFPGSPRTSFIPWADVKSDGYNLELLFLSSHSGTHLDAPYHFVRDGAKIDGIPLSRLMGEAVLCRMARGADGQVTRDDILEFERRHGRIPRGAAVVFGTGWSRNVARSDYFTKNPGLSAGAARHLLAREPSLVGIDSPSIDLGSDPKFPVHHVLLKSGIPIVENLCNLGRIRGTRFRLIVLPLKLRGATGSPARAVAV